MANTRRKGEWKRGVKKRMGKREDEGKNEGRVNEE